MGLYRNGRVDFTGVVPPSGQGAGYAFAGPSGAFDLNGNSRIDFADSVALFGEV